MPFIQTPRLQVHYEIAARGETPLVLLHGNFASWRWWRPLLEALPEGYTAYAPDLRGCGDSERPAAGYTIGDLAADLRGFAGALGLASFHLVGHSLGGAAALQFALDDPRPVRSLTLVAPPPAEGMPLFPTARRRRPWVSRLLEIERDASLATLDSVYRLLRTLGANRPLLRGALTRLTPTLTHDGAFDVLVDDAAHMAPEAVVGFVQTLDGWNVRAELGRLYVPTLVVGGGRDVLISQGALERTARGFPNARLALWPDVGHAPQLEQPERFRQALFEFIAESERAGRADGWRGLWNRWRSRRGG